MLPKQNETRTQLQTLQQQLQATGLITERLHSMPLLNTFLHMDNTSLLHQTSPVVTIVALAQVSHLFTFLISRIDMQYTDQFGVKKVSMQWLTMGTFHIMALRRSNNSSTGLITVCLPQPRYRTHLMDI
jgi:hypothetical protein